MLNYDFGMLSGRRRSRRSAIARRLSFESLESRQMLATFVVGTAASDSSTPFGPPGQEVHTLRSAITAANDNGTGHDTIAFDSSLSGQTIHITNGPMVVESDVSFLGPAGNIIVAHSSGSNAVGIEFAIGSGVAATNVIDGLTITGFNVGLRIASLQTSDLYVIRDSTFHGNISAGVEVMSGAPVSIGGNNLITGNSLNGIHVHDVAGGSVTVIGNTITDNGRGIYLNNANQEFDIVANFVGVTAGGVAAGNGTGILVANSNSSVASEISNNFIGANGDGILLSNSQFPNLVISSNGVGIDSLFQSRPNGTGINLQNGAEFASISFNSISNNNGNGIKLSDITGGIIHYNTISNNFGNGIRAGEQVADLLVELNDFAQNAGAAVFLEASASVANSIVSNYYVDNAGLPIDLESPMIPGFNPNDPEDADSGPNQLINYPQILDAVQLVGGGWRVYFGVDVDQPGTYFVQFSEFEPITATLEPLQDPSTQLFATTDVVINAQDIQLGFDFVGFVDIAPQFVTQSLGALNVGNALTANLTGKVPTDANAGNSSEFAPAIVLNPAPPRITDVQLFGSAWLRAPYSYATIAPTGKQLAPIYTQGVDELSIEFSEYVDMDGTELSLYGSNGAVIDPSGFSFDLVNFTATWTFASALPPDKYRIELTTDVQDAAGNALNGEWSNIAGENPIDPNSFTYEDFDDDSVTADNTFPSGNGIAGDAFDFWFSLLPGDSNQDGRVTSADDAVLASVGDINGDGLNDNTDVGLVNDIINLPGISAEFLPVSQRFGDYDDNEIVDELDYMVWKMTYGNVPPEDMRGDGNLDNLVDAADYTVWRNNVDDYSAWYNGPIPNSGGGGLPIVLFGEAPRVANVTVSGSMSTHPAYSFDQHVGSGEQLQTVPVGLADTISITFTEDVNISANMLSLVGLRTANRPTLVEFSYDLGTMTASWRFESWALGDHYAISLSDAVTDVEGNPLDGEWVNPVSISTVNAAVSEFPSGDGTAGGDFNFVATLLPGDANLNAIIDSADMSIVGMNWGQSNSLFADGDFNGDGIVNGDDSMIWMQDWYQNGGTNLQSLQILADLNGDWVVDQADADVLYDNWYNNLQNPTQADGDLDVDGDIDINDLDLVFAQWGLELSVVS